MNSDPASNILLLLVCATSQVDKVRKWTRGYPKETRVEVSQEEYECFTKPTTVFNCNYLLAKTKDELKDKVTSGHLKRKEDIPPKVYKKLKRGVLQSPNITEEYKKLIR